MEDPAQAVEVSENQVFKKPSLKTEMTLEIEHNQEKYESALVHSLNLVHHKYKAICEHHQELDVQISPENTVLVEYRSRYVQSTQHRHYHCRYSHFNKERVVYLAFEHQWINDGPDKSPHTIEHKISYY